MTLATSSDPLKVADLNYEAASRKLKALGFRWNNDRGLYQRDDVFLHLTKKWGKYRPVVWNRAARD